MLDYHLMQAYRNSGYYSGNIQDSRNFLCSHPSFFVLDSPNANTLYGDNNSSPDLRKPNWFDVNIRTVPQFEWKIIDAFDAPGVKRRLISVNRNAPLEFCSHP